MSPVTITRRRSNLSRMVGETGGMTVLAALRGAARETAGLLEEGRTILAEAIAGLEAAAGGQRDAGWPDRVYAAARDVIEICPPEAAALHRAAYSLCDLIDLQLRLGRSDAPSVAVHVQAIRLLAAPDVSDAVATPILDGLRAVLERQAASR
jgi:hypothetical protein